MALKRFRGASPMEQAFGASRAVRVGSLVFTGGIAAWDPAGGIQHPGDPARQLEAALEHLVAVLGELGAGPERVVRLTLHLARMEDWPQVAPVHERVLGRHRPALTLLHAPTLPDPAMRVQVEAVAALREIGEVDEEPTGAYVRRPTRRAAGGALEGFPR